MPVTEQGSCGASAARSLGGSESDLRLDRLSARAKQAGADHQGRGSLPTRADQKQVEHATYNRAMPVSLGTDRLLASGTPRRPPRRRRLQPGVDRRASCGTSPIALAARPGGARLAAIFGPQHGFRSDVQENMIETATRATTLRRVPVYSLYSETREPTAEMLARPRRARRSICRTSARASTPTSTRWRTACVAARTHGVHGRSSAIGRIRSAASRSKGRCSCAASSRSSASIPIPMRHGMTIGELARLFNEHFGIGAELEVVPMEGWRARHVLRRDRPAVGAAVAEHPDARHARSSIRAPCCSKARTSPKAAARRRPFELRRRAVGRRRALRRRAERARRCRACTSGRRSSSRRSTSTRSTQLRRLPDSRARSRGVPAGRDRRRADRGVPRGGSRSLRAGAIRRTSTSTRSCRSTSWRDRRQLREQIEAGVPAREIARSWEPAGRRVQEDARTRICSTDRVSA